MPADRETSRLKKTPFRLVKQVNSDRNDGGIDEIFSYPKLLNNLIYSKVNFKAVKLLFTFSVSAKYPAMHYLLPAKRHCIWNLMKTLYLYQPEKVVDDK